MPKTGLGWWSVGLIAAFLVLFVVFHLLVVSGQRGGDTLADNLVLSIPILLAGISGVLAFFTGIVSIVWSGERSVPVFLSSAIGLLILVFILGEIVSPH